MTEPAAEAIPPAAADAEDDEHEVFVSVLLAMIA